MTDDTHLQLQFSILEMRGVVYESQRYSRGVILFSKYAEHIEGDVGYLEREVSYHVNCVSSVLFSYFALEAYINEIFYMLTENEEFGVHLSPFCHIPESTKTKLKMLVPGNKDKTLEKYDAIALIINESLLPKGGETRQNIELLSSLRNKLVHYKLDQYKIVENGILLDEIKDLRAKLHKKFDLNPLVPAEAVYFPDKVISLGASRWAYKAVYDFIQSFHKETNLRKQIELPEMTE